MEYNKELTKASKIKIAYIGGGSHNWARIFMNDIAVDDSISGEVRLYDINFQSPSVGIVLAAVLTVVLLLLSGFASGSEIAFFSLSPTDIASLDTEKSSKDKNIKMLRNDSERTLATILITNNKLLHQDL